MGKIKGALQAAKGIKRTESGWGQRVDGRSWSTKPGPASKHVSVGMETTYDLSHSHRIGYIMADPETNVQRRAYGQYSRQRTKKIGGKTADRLLGHAFMAPEKGTKYRRESTYTVSLRPHIWKGATRKQWMNTLGGHVLEKNHTWQPFNFYNLALLGGGGEEAEHVENKIKHQQYYTRKQNGKTQKVRNPNYMRRMV